MKKVLSPNYLELLKTRRKKSRVSRDFQLIGLELTRVLDDETHKSLYIKLAKDYDGGALLRLAKNIAERTRVKRKGAYFMRLLQKSGLKLKEAKKKMKILSIADKKDEKFLQTKTAPFEFKKDNLKEIRDTIKEMRRLMKEANGIGLSANQVGIPRRFFITELPTETGKSSKFYYFLNPEITKKSDEKVIMEEGCLSIPGVFGSVLRPEKITLEGFNFFGKKIKVKADGLLARVFQHEMDHLNGILFTDRSKTTRIVENGKNGY